MRNQMTCGEALVGLLEDYGVDIAFACKDLQGVQAALASDHLKPIFHGTHQKWL